MNALPPVAILAGGLATRLRPLTDNLPKALVPVNAEPFIAHQLRLLRAKGITHVVLCLGYCAELVEQFVGDGRRFCLETRYSYDGASLLGTAGAIRRALPLLGEFFCVLYGDSYLPCDYGAVVSRFLEERKLGLMTVFRNRGRWERSNVEFRSGRIRAYDKQNPTTRMQHVDYGLGVFQRQVFDGPNGAAADLADVYQDLLACGQLAALEVRERFYEVGSFAGIKALQRFLHTHQCHA